MTQANADQRWPGPGIFTFVCVLLITLLSPGEEALNEYLKTKTVTLEY